MNDAFRKAVVHVPKLWTLSAPLDVRIDNKCLRCHSTEERIEFSGFSSLQQQRRWGWDDALWGVAGEGAGIKCFGERDGAGDAVLDKKGDDGNVSEVEFEEEVGGKLTNGSATSQGSSASRDSLSLGIREPVYEVVEVRSNGMVSSRKINRRHLLKSSGL
ncbi:magnesium transporter MRS2-11, chloroplastic-like [Andrographis paniculata]|uniref:magnesium transporter MRS2-11, chloroplastic-like n=1 Tax=Andrographis paniculata TaxID=175694 RepID=UPI0021E6F2FD|nr:magnesium transporter MRS2-11, chloroplastic-like [Andrographis paniculata]